MILFANNQKSFFAAKPLISGFFLLALMGFSFSPAFAMPPLLKVSGNQIVTASGGCTVRLTGVNVDSTEWMAAGEAPPGGSFMTQVQEAVQYWNVNLIRIAIDQDWWDGNAQTTPTNRGATSQANYQALVDSVVAYCNTNNIYCDLDLHWSGTGTATTATQQNSMPDDLSTTFWQSVAARYANNPSVLFDLFNEPFTNSWTVWLNGGTTTEGFHTPGFQSLLNTVRNTSSGGGTYASGTKAENICIVGGQQYSYYYVGMSPVVDVAGGNGVVYSAHIYNNKGTNTPAGWQTNIDPALAYGPVLIEEFGDSANTNDGGAFVNSVLTWMNGTNDKNYVYGGMAWDLDKSAGPPLLSAWSSTLGAPVSTGTGWVLTDYEGQQVYGWLKGMTYPTCSAGPTSTPTRTATATLTSTRTLTPTVTATRTLTPTPTLTRTPTVAATATYTFSATASPTKTATSTSSPTSTTVFTATKTSTPSSTPSLTRTLTPIPTPTNSFSPTASPSRTLTFTPTASYTPSPTATGTATSTPPSTATRTVTPTPSNTTTVLPSPTVTLTGTQTSSPTVTSTLTVTSTRTLTQTLTPSSTPTQTTTRTPTWTVTSTPTVTSSATITTTVLPSLTPTLTGVPTATSSPTVTQTVQFTFTKTPTLTVTPTPSWTATASATSAFTSTLTSTPTASASPTKTLTASATPTRTSTVAFTATPTATLTATLAPTVSLQLTSSSPTVDPGQGFTYEFNLTITGGAAQNGVLTQTLPANLTVTGFITGPSGVVSGNQITWNLSSLPVGTTQLEVSVDVDPSTAGGTNLASQGTFTYTGGSASSNSASVSVTAPTPTPTPSFVATLTGTPTPPSSTGGGTHPPVLFPNPVTGPGPVTIQLPNYPGSGIVSLQVFTTAFRMVNSLPPKSEAGGSDVTLPLTDRKGAPLADGLYYVLVTSPAGKSILKLLILR